MAPLPPANLELLSAYLDNELPPAERAALEARLAAEAELQAELDALRQVTALVGTLPVYRAPRDFTLDPAVYSRPAQTVAQAPRRAYPARIHPGRVYRAASLVSALAAALVFLIGVLGVLSQRQPTQLASAPQPAVQQESAGPADDDAPDAAQVTSVAAAPTLEAQAIDLTATSLSNAMQREAQSPTPTLLSPPDQPGLDEGAAEVPADGESADDGVAQGFMADEAEEAADEEAVPAEAEAAEDMTEAEAPTDMVLDEGADADQADTTGQAELESAGDGDADTFAGPPPSAPPATGPATGGEAAGIGGAIAPPSSPTPVIDETAAVVDEADSEESAPLAAMPTQTALAFAIQSTATSRATATRRATAMPTVTLTVTATPTPLPTDTLTPTPAPTQAPTLAPNATVTARDAADTAPFQLDPGILIGASVALLALAVVFFALARRGA